MDARQYLCSILEKLDMKSIWKNFLVSSIPIIVNDFKYILNFFVCVYRGRVWSAKLWKLRLSNSFEHYTKSWTEANILVSIQKKIFELGT